MSSHNIEQFIQSKPVVVYMKGMPDSPLCGFSAHTVEVLRAAGVTPDQMAAFDVLSDESVRSGIKQYSNWPTIPQVYIRGKFIGGCDIVTEMFQNGELQQILKG